MLEDTPDVVIVGEQVAGRAEHVKRAINKLIKAQNTNMFDLAELLHEAKSKAYYNAWGYESYPKYARSLDIKYTKAFYLVKIVENMNAAGVTREQYEPVGLGKLRRIARLKPESEYKGVPMVVLIRELTLKAKDMTVEEVQKEVDVLLGLTEDESMCWLNVQMKILARENVVKPAFLKAKRFMGQKKGEDDQMVDASDGAALEMICANFLADPNFDVEEEVAPQPETKNGTPEATEPSISTTE